MLQVNEMHTDSQITDMLYFTCDNLNSNKYLVTCSELPNPELIISEVQNDSKSLKVIAKAKDHLQEQSKCGYTCLA